MKPYTLLVDGNHFLHQTYHVAKQIDKRNKKQGALDFFQSPSNDKRLLFWKLSLDFASVIKRFGGCIDSIVYCIDSSSWRKEYKTSDVTYKANRKQEEEINWSGIFDAHDAFVNTLKEFGVTISRVPGCEGDDLIYGWSNYLNMNDRNCIIMSGDNDLVQLINYTPSYDTTTIFYNKFTETLYTFQGFDKWLEGKKKAVEENVNELDIFDTDPTELNKDIINTFESALKKVKKQEVEVHSFVVRKIIEGDPKDNVTSVYSYQKETKKGDLRTYGVKGKKVDTILERFKKKWGRDIHINDMFNSEVLSYICKMVMDVMNIKNTNLTDLIEKLKDNRNLILLHMKCIPDAIVDAMYDNIEEREIQLSQATINKIKDKNNIMEEYGYELEDENKGTSSDFFNDFM